MSVDGVLDERGVSNTVGIVLLFGMVLTGATLVFLVGGMALDGIEGQSETRSAEMSMQEVRSDLSSLATRGEGSTQLSVGETDNAEIRTDGSMSFTIHGQTRAGIYRDCTTNLSLSSLRYGDGDERRVAYQAGGVWKTSEGGGSTMVSPPALSYRTEEINGTEYRTFDFDIANLTGRVDTGGETTASVNQTRSRQRREQIEREMFCRTDDDAGQPVTKVRSLTIVVRNSTYYDAWGRFLDDRMGGAGNVTVSDHNRTVIARDLPMGKVAEAASFRPDPDNLLVAVNDTAAAETSHKLTFQVADDKAVGNTLEAIEIKYEDGETDLSNLVGAGVNGRINHDQTKIHRENGSVVDLKDHVESYNADTSDGTIGFQFDDSVEIRENDTITIEYGSQNRNGKDGKVTNPDAPGTYNVTATLNDDSDNLRSGVLAIDDEADGLLGNRTDGDEDEDGVPDFADRCPDTAGEGRFGCGVVSEHPSNAVQVNSSTATLELVGTQIAEERTITVTGAERQPLDVMFVLDESGSMDLGSDWYGTSDWEEVSRDDVAWEDTFEFFGGTYYVVPDGIQVRTETEIHDPGDSIREPDSVVEIRDAEYGPIGSDPEGQRIDATKSFIGALNNSAALNESEKDRAGTVVFNSGAVVREGLTHDFDDINESLTEFASGGTDIGAGLYEALPQFEDSSDAERVVVLLSDGENDGATDEKTIEAAEEAADQNVTVYTVGLGDGADEELLRDVANTTGGQYFFVEDADELEDQFDQIAGDVTEDQRRQVEHKEVQTSVQIGGQNFSLDPAVENATVNGNDTGSTANDPNSNDPITYEIQGIEPGTLLSFSATSIDCTNSTTPYDDKSELDPNLGTEHEGEEYEHTSCTAASGRIDRTDNSTSAHEIYTDGDELPDLDTAWWQPGVETVLDTYGEESLYSGNEFELDESQAIVVVELDSSEGNHTNYAVFLYDADAGDRGDYDDPNEDTNRYVIDISPTQVEVGDEE